MSTIAKCTPSLGNVSLFWARTSECIVWPMNTAKAIFYLRDSQGGEIAETRNAIVDLVLDYDTRHKVDYFFWLDDDVLTYPGVLLELLHYATTKNKEIVSGVYFNKSPGNGSQPLIFPSKYGGADRFKPNQVYETWGHGMGLCLIKADVYKRLHRELKLRKDKYGRVEFYKTSGVHQVDDDGLIHTGYTEDLYFLDLVSKIGIKPLIVCTPQAFGWHYDGKASKDYPNGKGYPEKQWNQWMSNEDIRWDVPSGEVVWK